MRVSGFGVRVSGGRKIAPAPSYYPKPQTRDPKPGYLIALSSSIAKLFLEILKSWETNYKKLNIFHKKRTNIILLLNFCPSEFLSNPKISQHFARFMHQNESKSAKMRRMIWSFVAPPYIPLPWYSGGGLGWGVLVWLPPRPLTTRQAFAPNPRLCPPPEYQGRRKERFSEIIGRVALRR
jgi:hypothetical protein